MLNKLVQFGRRALFIVRVLSGYEERRIRSYRMLLQKRQEQAEARKQALQRLPEQTILREVRKVVEEMQALNRQLEEAEAAIEEYFKPIDKSAQMLMNMQLEREERHSKEVAKLMQQQLAHQREHSVSKNMAGNVDMSKPSHHVTPNRQNELTTTTVVADTVETNQQSEPEAPPSEPEVPPSEPEAPPSEQREVAMKS